MVLAELCRTDLEPRKWTSISAWWDPFVSGQNLCTCSTVQVVWKNLPNCPIGALFICIFIYKRCVLQGFWHYTQLVIGQGQNKVSTTASHFSGIHSASKERAPSFLRLFVASLTLSSMGGSFKPQASFLGHFVCHLLWHVLHRYRIISQCEVQLKLSDSTSSFKPDLTLCRKATDKAQRQRGEVASRTAHTHVTLVFSEQKYT